MTTMLAAMIYQCNPDLLSDWVKLASNALEMDSPMERDEGMLAIYEAACVLGIGHEGRGNWHPTDRYYEDKGIWKTGFGIEPDGFSNIYDICPFEPNPGWPAEWDYRSGVRYYSLGHSSVANLEPFFSYYVERDKTFPNNLSRKEDIDAVAKLRLAYLVQFSGGYKVAETDWSDPFLADASKARETILNSPTTIQKGEELVLGETYTGTAYYVSEDGNDNNDGLTPETAWATLKKLEYTTFEYGDAVFFNRGDSWYGRLIMQAGVTYSAYGEGAKPIITGSPLDMAQSEKWILHEETEDGGKIWKYNESIGNCGVLLLNGGEIIARKEYPLWDGEQYTTAEGNVYDVTKDLADLSYFPAIDNIHFRCYAGMGMDCCSNDNIVYQNCEASWCGGGVQRYAESVYQHNPSAVNISGGGLLLFGSNVTGRNNYIHDCESKGVAVVVNGGYGWRQMNQLDMEEKGVPAIRINNLRATGEVLFENNLFYRSAGSLICANATENEEGEGAIFPTLRGNTYVQDRGQILFDNTMPMWKEGAGTTLLTSDQTIAEECVRDYLGDTTGKVVILEPLKPLVTIETMPAMVWAMGKSSPVSMKTILTYDEAYRTTHYGEPLTCEDAICAVLRLYETAADTQQ